MINLEQDFIKFETDGQLAYYGYTNNIGASDSDNVWSIRLMTGTSSQFDIQWSNNTKLNFISKWSEKEDYFQFDGSASFGLTWSTTNSSEYKYALNVEWDDLEGYDIYNISIFNDGGNLVNKNNIQIYNVWSDISTDVVLSNGGSKLNYTFYTPFGLTYSFKLESSNVAGKLSENFNFSLFL
jgi:hypothetical protein